MKSIKKSTWIKIAVVLGIILAYLLVPGIKVWFREAIRVLSNLDVEGIKEYILSFGLMAPIISFLLMVFQSIIAPLPAFLITFANAGLFGWVKGALLSWISAMVGALLCFYIARLYGRNTVEKLTNRFALKEIDGFFERHGKFAILIARLLPFISFDIVSYAAGLTSISLWSFLWATGIGQLPATIVYSYVGGMLTGGTRTFVYGLLILFSVTTLIFLLKRIWKEREISKN